MKDHYAFHFKLSKNGKTTFSGMMPCKKEKWLKIESMMKQILFME